MVIFIRNHKEARQSLWEIIKGRGESMNIDGKKVAIMIAERKLNFHEAAVSAGLTAASLSAIVNGKTKKANYATAGKIAEMLGVGVAEIMAD